MKSVVFEPRHVYTFNRCPILAYMNVDMTPPFGTLVRKHALSVAKDFKRDPHTARTLSHFLDEWNEDWVKTEPVLEPYSKKKKIAMASSGVRKLSSFYGDLAKLRDRPRKLPVDVDNFIMMNLGIFPKEGSGEMYHLFAKAPVDMVMPDDTLVTLSVYGGGRQNPFMSPLSMPSGWAQAAWDGNHIVRDLSSVKRVYNLKLKGSEEFKETLTMFLRGMAHVLTADIISGKFVPTCTKCGRCGGKYYIERGLFDGKGYGQETADLHPWARGSKPKPDHSGEGTAGEPDGGNLGETDGQTDSGHREESHG